MIFYFFLKKKKKKIPGTEKTLPSTYPWMKPLLKFPMIGAASLLSDKNMKFFYYIIFWFINFSTIFNNKNEIVKFEIYYVILRN